jgi:hypothetical protein
MLRQNEVEVWERLAEVAAIPIIEVVLDSYQGTTFSRAE